MKYLPKSRVIYHSQLEALRHQPSAPAPASASEGPAIDTAAYTAPLPAAPKPSIETLIHVESIAGRRHPLSRTKH